MAGAMMERITLMCFGASYAVALLLEIVRLLRPVPILRILSLIAVGAGLLAHSLFIIHWFFIVQPMPPLASQFGSLLFLALILAVFDLYGSIHHPRVAWALFVLPLVLGLIGLADLFRPGPDALVTANWGHGEVIWNTAHGILLLLAAVGVCVGFVASVMYLVQARRLRGKTPPGQGLQLLSLERLEEMNRRAVMWAFPLLTAGILIGVMQLAAHSEDLHGWGDPQDLSAAGLWVVFAIAVVSALSRQPARPAGGDDDHNRLCRVDFHSGGLAHRCSGQHPMRLAAIGCSFRTTPVGLRERLAFDPAKLVWVLDELCARYGCEAVVLSTCNRVELYLGRADAPLAGEPSFLPDAELIAEFLSEVHLRRRPTRSGRTCISTVRPRRCGTCSASPPASTA